MDIKNWTWRKRISEKSGENTGDHFTPSRVTLGDHLESTAPWADRDPKPRVQASSPSPVLPFQENEAKQHAKVAEEAVAGWEKAEAETESVKRQLEQAQREKASLQDRLSHLDGALKDCTRQVRLVREEQEHKRQELLQKKNKEIEKLRVEYEGKLADVGRQLVEAGAENKVMGLTLQEQVRATAEVTDSKSRIEAEMNLLRQRMETFEKEKGGLKYEVHVLNKQIQIRNEERDYSKRDIDNLNRQHSEDVKKMNRLEAECQRLRILVRRKLPGPNALAQMKLEAETLDGEAIRKRCNGNREIELLLERLLSMEEETKMLKEALTQRNGELQSSRLMCAKTATKLSALEAYFESVSRTHGVPKPGLNGTEAERVRENGTNATDDEVSRADAWASALIAELSQFRKNKLELSETPVPDIDSIMDDFTDMERLAASELTPSDKSFKTLTELTSKSPTEEMNSGAEHQMPVKRKLDFLAQGSFSEEKTEEELSSLISRGMEFVEGLARAAGVNEFENPLVEKTNSLLHEKKPQLGVLWEFISELLVVVDGLLSEFLRSVKKVQKVDCETQTIDDPAITSTTAGGSEDQKVELEMLRVEKLALESHMKSELGRMVNMEGEVGQLKNDKVHLVDQIEQLSAQFRESQQLVEELQTKLASKEEALVLSEVRNQNRAQSSNGAFMQDVVSRLEQELEEEYKNHSKQQESEAQEKQPVVEDNRSLRKEQEIADAEEKLAECQRTILALGKQLKALSGQSPHHSAETSMDSRANSMLSIVRKYSDSEDLDQENLSTTRRSPLPSFKEESYGFSPGSSPMPRAQFFYARSQTETGTREVHDYFSTEDSSSEQLSFSGSSPMRQRGGGKPKRSSFSRFFRSSKNT